MNLEFDIWRAIFEYDISEDITKETEKLDLKEE